MKKGKNLLNKLVGGALGITMAFMPLASQAQYKTEAPIKPKSVVSSNFIPVKSLVKTIDYSTMKPVKELQETTINYVSPEEGFSKGLTYAPAENHFYDEKTSKMAQGYTMDVTSSFYGDIYLDTFAQPHLVNNFEEHTAFYGSGDANQDGVTNREDLNVMIGSNVDEADVNGDGTKGDQSDYNVLEAKLKNNAPYLPANFELLKTESEKISWTGKVLAIDQTNTHPPGPDWDCDQYAMQAQINFSGVENISGSPLNNGVYDTIFNNRFDLPLYQVSTRYQNGDLHEINSILVGTNPLDFDSWYYFEPQTDQEQNPGNPSLNEMANNEKYVYFWSNQFNQYFYNMNMVVNFDLQGPPSLDVYDPDLVLTKREKFNYVHIGGLGPADVQINYGEDTDPSNTGEVTGNADWSTVHWSDGSSTQSGTVQDSTYYNYDLFRNWSATSDSSIWIDTVYMDEDPFYGNLAQKIMIRDTTAGTTNNPGTLNLNYSTWPAGITAPDGWDECGEWTTTRTLDSTNRSSNPLFREHYYFSEWYTDETADPSGNSSSESFEVNVSLDNHYWTSFPANWSHYYKDPLTPSNTGGLPTADNPVPEIDVITNPNPEMKNSTYNPDPLSPNSYNWEFDWNHNAADEVCYDTIWGTQHVNVYKPNALVWTNPETIQDTFYIGENDIVHPSSIYEPEYQDSLETWFPTDYDWDKTTIQVTPTDSIFRLDFEGYEAVCNTTFEGPDYIVKKARTVGIGKNGLEKKAKDIFLPYPNPTHSGKLNIKINSQDENLRKVYWEAYDVMGSLVDHSKEVIHPGLNDFEIDLHGMQKGVYLLRFKHTDYSDEKVWIIYY